MDLLLALLIQSGVAPEGAGPARAPQLPYANEAATQAVSRPRVNQGRGFRIDWTALDDSLTTQSRQEGRPAAPSRPVPSRAAPGRTTLWNGVAVRMIDGRPHGVW